MQSSGSHYPSSSANKPPMLFSKEISGTSSTARLFKKGNPYRENLERGSGEVNGLELPWYTTLSRYMNVKNRVSVPYVMRTVTARSKCHGHARYATCMQRISSAWFIWSDPRSSSMTSEGSNEIDRPAFTRRIERISQRYWHSSWIRYLYWPNQVLFFFERGQTDGTVTRGVAEEDQPSLLKIFL